MTAATKPNLGLTEGWAPGDSGWGDPMNDNLDLLDAVVMLGVISATVLAPPTDPAPAEGDRYIIPTGATGDWSTHIGNVALFQDAAWLYLAPKVGWTARVAGGPRLDWTGTEWAEISAGLPEAPEDNTSYARKNGDWVAIGDGGGLPEAPEDGKQYARKDGDWSEVEAAAAALHDLTDVDDSGKAQAVVLTYDTTESKWIARLIALGSLVSFTGFGFDPATKGAHATIDNNGADVTLAEGQFENARGLAPMLTKTYFEITVLELGTYFGMANTIGIGDAASDTTSGPAMYNNAGQVAGFALSLGQGATYENGNQWDSSPTGTVGDVFGFAYDPAARKCWYRKNGGVWNEGRTVPGGDPVAGTNGISISYTMNMIAMVFASDFTSDAKYRMNNGQFAWHDTPPTGYAGSTSTTAAPSLGLADVTITSVADGDTLVYDATLRKFVNKQPAESGVSSLAALTDVSLGTKANHDLLVYKASDTDWINAQLMLQTPSPLNSLDPTHTASGWTLSNGNKTAVSTTGQKVAVGLPALTSKTYFEVTINSGTISSNAGVGVGPQAPSSQGKIGFMTNSMGASLGGSIYEYFNGTFVGNNLGAFAVGDVVCVAYDPSTRTGWFRKNGGNWDNSGTDNPATGVGGNQISGTADSYPTITTDVVNQFTVNFGDQPFAFTVPSGFVAPAPTPDVVTPGDVNITSPVDGQMVQYDAASGKWMNKTYVPSIALASLTDVAMQGVTVVVGPPDDTTGSTSAFSWKGNLLTMTKAATTAKLTANNMTRTNGYTYCPAIIPVVSGVLGTPVFGTPQTATATDSTPQKVDFAFPTPVALANGATYAFVIGVQNQGDTTAVNIGAASSGAYSANAYFTMGTIIRIAKAAPVAGTAYDTNSSSTFPVRVTVTLVDLTPVDGQGLVYDATLGKWKNATIAASGGGGGTGSYTAPYRGTTTKITAAKAVSAFPYLVPWDATVRDSEGGWTVAAPTRLTVPAGKGITKIRLACNISFTWTSSSGLAEFDVIIIKNGTTTVGVAGGFSAVVSNGFITKTFSAQSLPLDATDGDYFEVRINGAGSTGWTVTAFSLADTNGSNGFNMEIVETSAGVNPPYDIPMFFPGKPANSQRMARIRLARPVQVSKTAAHLADADAAATAAVSMPLKQNGSAIGTVTFAAGSATGVINFTNDVAFAAGDTLTWDNQAAADATLGNISVTLLGTRTA